MTAYCVLNLVEDLGTGTNSSYTDLNWHIKILKPVSMMEGTSARLIEGDQLSIRELLFGMMLPSGNDAAQALGIHFGQLLLNKGKSDPNKDFILCPDALARKCKELKI